MPQAQLYVLSDQYYQDFPDDKLMQNKDVINGTLHSRPCSSGQNRIKSINMDIAIQFVSVQAKRGAKVIFPDVFKIYHGLEQQLQQNYIKHG